MNIPYKYSVKNIQIVCSSMNILNRYHVKEYFVFRKLAMTPSVRSSRIFRIFRILGIFTQLAAG